MGFQPKAPACFLKWVLVMNGWARYRAEPVTLACLGWREQKDPTLRGDYRTIVGAVSLVSCACRGVESRRHRSVAAESSRFTASTEFRNPESCLRALCCAIPSVFLIWSGLSLMRNRQFLIWVCRPLMWNGPFLFGVGPSPMRNSSFLIRVSLSQMRKSRFLIRVWLRGCFEFCVS